MTRNNQEYKNIEVEENHSSSEDGVTKHPTNIEPHEYIAALLGF